MPQRTEEITAIASTLAQLGTAAKALDLPVLALILDAAICETKARLRDQAPAITQAAVLTTEMVAERWGCSDRHVRNLVKSGALGHFRLGGRLVRIPAAAVEQYERSHMRPTSPTDGSAQTPAPAPKPDGGLLRALARAGSRTRV